MPKSKHEELEDEELFDFEIFTKTVEIPDEPESITVMVENWDLGDSALVRSDAGEYRIVSKDYVVNSYSAQSIPFQAFQSGIVPYDWHDEINEVALTPDQMRQILYAQGYVVKRDISLAELAKNLLVRGKIPVLRR